MVMMYLICYLYAITSHYIILDLLNIFSLYFTDFHIHGRLHGRTFSAVRHKSPVPGFTSRHCYVFHLSFYRVTCG